MEAKRKALLMILLPFLLASCANEVIVNAPGEAVPVVYCLLNPDAGEQYVRLGRSFQTDPAHPDSPPVTDSTVWNLPVTVYLEEWQDGEPTKTISFDPITATPKDTGFFPEDNLRIYRSDFRPKRLTSYRLYVSFPDDYRIVTGETTIPGRPVVLDPLEIPGRKINFQAGVSYKTRWNPGVGGGVFQGRFTITYTENRGNQLTDGTVGFFTNPLLGLGSEIEMSDIVNGNRFFAEMIRQVPVEADVIREVINVQFVLYKGGEELALLVSPDLEQTSITGNLNHYTNLFNAIGVFSSLQQVSVPNLMLSNTTINELAHGELTQRLGFRDIHGEEPQSPKP